MARLSFRRSSIITHSPRVVLEDFSVKEKGHTEVLEKLFLDIIALKLEDIRCTDLIRYSKDPVVLQEFFVSFLPIGHFLFP